ncbi:hypothetical protein HGP14_15845 [Rhizobium sp. P32RR-XVIII]|uniref:hypothetical protein n=1 Tax=Rhizobium sp. P32RR-XVIII TaxID=2726738 RepID=UPI0014572B3C|nr:hypothetical protein [Rhizobium sp. P32RR-XVIII]NLS04829.1 hypothetical protein [Rhizobium sp. P32RR-XVIII]
MTLPRTVHRLFLFVAMLAVLVAPASIGLAGSAMAFSLPAMTADMGSMPGMKMTEEMPCCPEQQPVKTTDCAKDCPLSLVCTTSISAPAPDIHGWSFAISWLPHSYGPISASQLMSAFLEPPARPPKA